MVLAYLRMAGRRDGAASWRIGRAGRSAGAPARRLPAPEDPNTQPDRTPRL